MATEADEPIRLQTDSEADEPIRLQSDSIPEYTELIERQRRGQKTFISIFVPVFGILLSLAIVGWVRANNRSQGFEAIFYFFELIVIAFVPLLASAIFLCIYVLSGKRRSLLTKPWVVLGTSPLVVFLLLTVIWLLVGLRIKENDDSLQPNDVFDQKPSGYQEIDDFLQTLKADEPDVMYNDVNCSIMLNEVLLITPEPKGGVDGFFFVCTEPFLDSCDQSLPTQFVSAVLFDLDRPENQDVITLFGSKSTNITDCVGVP